jgi:hypothetical protein
VVIDTRDTETGFRREVVVLASFDLGGLSGSAGFNRAFIARLIDEVRVLPGVEAVAAASSVPLDIHGLPTRVFTVDGHARTESGFVSGRSCPGDHGGGGRRGSRKGPYVDGDPVPLMVLIPVCAPSDWRPPRFVCATGVANCRPVFETNVSGLRCSRCSA